MNWAHSPGKTSKECYPNVFRASGDGGWDVPCVGGKSQPTPGGGRPSPLSASVILRPNHFSVSSVPITLHTDTENNFKLQWIWFQSIWGWCCGRSPPISKRPVGMVNQGDAHPCVHFGCGWTTRYSGKNAGTGDREVGVWMQQLLKSQLLFSYLYISFL